MNVRLTTYDLRLLNFDSGLLTVVLLLIFHLSSLITLSQSTPPVLTLNTKMHTSRIRRISSDAEGKYILTCSSDKTAKLWNATEGSLIRTYRVPIEGENVGFLYACALSPDGNTIAVGGYSNNKDPESVYIINALTGSIIQTLRNFPNVIADLEFSDDGRYLVVAGDLETAKDQTENKGISIFEQDKYGRFVFYKLLTGYLDQSENVVFDHSGRLATVCDDGKVRLYNADFSLVSEREMQEGKKPYSVAFSPDGTLLALAYSDSPVIEVLDGKNLGTVYKPDVAGANYGRKFEVVSFSHDGKYLYAGGDYRILKTGELQNNVRCWNNAGKGSYINIPAGDNTILDIKPLPDGSMVVCSAHPDFGVVTADSLLHFKPSEINDYFAKNRNHFTINSTGTILGFEPLNNSALLFSVNDKMLITADKADARINRNELKTCTDKADNIEITEWDDSYFPKINGNTPAVFDQQKNQRTHCRSVDIDKMTKNIVFGTFAGLICTDSAGTIKWRTKTNIDELVVNISGNSKIVAVAEGNGLLKWYRMSDGTHLLTLFAHPDNKRWILYTPTGYYDCSPGAEELIGWQVNNIQQSKVIISGIRKDFPAEKAGLRIGDNIIAIDDFNVETQEQTSNLIKEKVSLDSFNISVIRDGKMLGIKVKPVWDEKSKKRKIGFNHIAVPFYQEPSYYPADRFFETYYRPDLIQEIFKNYETDQEILKRWGDQANAVQNMKKPPLVKIVYDKDKSKENGENVSINIEVTDQGGGIDEILLFQNGKLVETTQRGFKPLAKNGTQRTKTYQLTLTTGENKIKASAFSAERIESNPDEITLNYAGVEKSTTLYLFVLGINQYKNSRYNLSYARADSESIRQSLLGGSKSIFRDVKVYELYDDQATRKNIEAKINEIASLAGQNDMFVFFYAGHGSMSEPEVNQQPLFYLIPTDVTKLYGDNEILKNLAISSSEIRDWCQNIKAQKQLIMMDACQSGGVVEAFAMRGAAEDKAILQLARSAGVAIFASTGTDQYAAEFTQIGHGVFTYALLDGLAGNADGGMKDKKITVKELEAWINDLIPELTQKYRGQAQYPNSFSTGMDFPVVIVK